MLHAAAMLIGLWAVWLAFTQGWTSTQDIAIGGGVALAVLVLSARFGGLGRGVGVFGFAPQLAFLALGRVGTVLSGAMATIRAGLAAEEVELRVDRLKIAVLDVIGGESEVVRVAALEQRVEEVAVRDPVRPAGRIHVTRIARTMR